MHAWPGFDNYCQLQRKSGAAGETGERDNEVKGRHGEERRRQKESGGQTRMNKMPCVFVCAGRFGPTSSVFHSVDLCVNFSLRQNDPKIKPQNDFKW